MKSSNLLVLFVIFCLSTLNLFSQEKTGQIYFIRGTGYVGSAVNFKVYLDDTLVCKLKNKTYSVHTVPAGKHTVAAQNTGLSDNKKSAPFQIEVKESGITYVDVAWADKVFCEEVTTNSAKMLMEKMKQTTNCHTKD